MVRIVRSLGCVGDEGSEVNDSHDDGDSRGVNLLCEGFVEVLVSLSPSPLLRESLVPCLADGGIATLLSFLEAPSWGM